MHETGRRIKGTAWRINRLHVGAVLVRFVVFISFSFETVEQ